MVLVSESFVEGYPLNDLYTLVGKHLTLHVVSGLSSPLIYMFTLTRHCFDYHCFAVSFEMEEYVSSYFVLSSFFLVVLLFWVPCIPT